MKRLLPVAALILVACPPVAEGEGECEPVAAADASDPYPRAHFSPAEGWMNDPCGVIELDDETHVFFQHNPTGLIWGNLHWGHATTDASFSSYTQLDPVLEPDDELGAPFSGTALLDEDNRSGLCSGPPCLVLAFTHAGGVGSQKQSIAFSEDLGATFQLFAGNPVIENPGIPDFRDPRVFFHAPIDRFVMVLGSGDRAKVFHSDDLVAWVEVSEIGPFPELPAGAFEVADLFELPDSAGGTRWIFKTDILPGFAQQGEGFYFVGDFDGTDFTVAAGPMPLDRGPDFYASTFVARSDPPKWIGWLSSWEYALDTPTEPYRGQLTTPRTLSLAGDRLVQTPIIAARIDPCPVARSADEVDGIEGDTFHLAATLSGDASFIFFEADDEEVVVGRAGDELFVDRTGSGAIANTFSARFAAPVSGTVDVEVIVDRFSVEVFAGDETITVSVYPRGSSRGVSVREAAGIDRMTLSRLIPEPR